jgi:hypothetical protein
MSKILLSIALGGSRLVLFDNAATGAAIGGSSLDAALTATTRSGRVLGASKFAVDVPLHPTFLCTGNNVALKGDTLRRVVLSRLLSTVDRPEERDGFAIPDLLHHVREGRGGIAADALTILRAYHVAGRPTPTPKPPPMGGFEAWTATVRRAVHWATGYDPCTTRTEARTVDKLATILPALIDGWAALCAAEGKSGLTATQALRALESKPAGTDTLHAILVESTKDGHLPSPQALGILFGLVRGRPVAGRALDTSTVRGVTRWKVCHLTNDPEAERADPEPGPDQNDNPPF